MYTLLTLSITPSLAESPHFSIFCLYIFPSVTEQILTFNPQLEKKQKDALHILRKFGNDLAHTNPKLAQIIQWQKARRQGQMCEVDHIVRSPQIDGYRNKCEFTIGEYPCACIFNPNTVCSSCCTGVCC